MLITIVGCGYVGLSTGIVLSKHHHINFVDIDNGKINKINSNISPIDTPIFNKEYKRAAKKIMGYVSIQEGIDGSDLVIVAIPTPSIEETGRLYLEDVVKVVDEINSINKEIPIVIRSTVSIGFNQLLSDRVKNENILYAPEFLKEKSAIKDVFYPSRIVIGINTNSKKSIQNASIFGKLMISSINKRNIKIRIMSYSEAEAVKLFSNAYLATRLTYFNELDDMAKKLGMSSENIISALGDDNRIGNFYNTPNENGYGGKCLPKDVSELAKLLGEDSLIYKVNENNNKRRKGK